MGPGTCGGWRGRFLGLGGDPEGVDVRGHQVSEGVVDQPVLGEAVQPLEATRCDADMEMATAILRAGVPDMQMTLIRDLENLGFEGCSESALDHRHSIGCPAAGHGMTCTNGLTLTVAQTPPAT